MSVWLPAGDYEVLVVHEAPEGVRDWPGVQPWMSVVTACTLKDCETTYCRVPLLHFNTGASDVVTLASSEHADVNQQRRADQLAAFLSACEAAPSLPTPGGYVLPLGEPVVFHTDDHRGCLIEPGELQVVPRERTRDQIAAVRHELPDDAHAARTRLSQLVDRLGWREFLQGWFCYAVAGITGLVFTRWGAIAMLEPWRREAHWQHALGLLVQVFLYCAVEWFAILVLTDSAGCHGPVPFRLH